MKLYGKKHIAGLRLDGSAFWSNFPQSEEQARIEGIARWEPFPPRWCESCRSNYLIYTSTGLPNCCAIHNSRLSYTESYNIGDPITAVDARAAGLDHYWRPEPGQYCGHLGKTALNGKCWYCEQERVKKGRSPRQDALAAGEVWYMPVPGETCAAGHHARRRVSNGSCEECEAVKRAAAAPSVPVVSSVDPARIDRVCPDLIISRNDARAAGFTVFRTGKACKAGHTDWRYVTTGNCLACRRV